MSIQLRHLLPTVVLFLVSSSRDVVILYLLKGNFGHARPQQEHMHKFHSEVAAFR